MSPLATTVPELEAKLLQSYQQNQRLRAALAIAKDPCIYCQLPLEEMSKCQHGFPGCCRADDLQGCPEFGAMLEMFEAKNLVNELILELRRFANRELIQVGSEQHAKLIYCWCQTPEQIKVRGEEGCKSKICKDRDRLIAKAQEFLRTFQ